MAQAKHIVLTTSDIQENFDLESRDHRERGPTSMPFVTSDGREHQTITRGNLEKAIALSAVTGGQILVISTRTRAEFCDVDRWWQDLLQQARGKLFHRETEEDDYSEPWKAAFKYMGIPFPCYEKSGDPCFWTQAWDWAYEKELFLDSSHLKEEGE